VVVEVGLVVEVELELEVGLVVEVELELDPVLEVDTVVVLELDMVMEVDTMLVLELDRMAMDQDLGIKAKWDQITDQIQEWGRLREVIPVILQALIENKLHGVGARHDHKKGGHVLRGIGK
jgi:hypothetical protein